MTAALRNAWQGLTDTQTEGQGGYRLALVHSTEQLRVFAAVESTTGAHGILLDLPVDPNRRDPHDLLCKAFSVTTAPFPGMAANRIGLLILLRDLDYEDLFGLLANDILESVRAAANAQHAAADATRVVDRWRHFMERRRASMTDDRVRGLIGELIVLARLLSSGDKRETLTSWTGPHDAIHDFELPDDSIEVKTFLAEDGPTVRISDPRQLEVVQTRPVHLIAVKLARSTTKGHLLPAMIDSVIGQLQHAPGATELFEKKLAEYGYLPNHAALYSQAYACEQLLSYTVRERFPRLKAEEMPIGISDVQYSISLSSLTDFRIDPLTILRAAPTMLEIQQN